MLVQLYQFSAIVTGINEDGSLVAMFDLGFCIHVVKTFWLAACEVPDDQQLREEFCDLLKINFLGGNYLAETSFSGNQVMAELFWEGNDGDLVSSLDVMKAYVH